MIEASKRCFDACEIKEAPYGNFPKGAKGSREKMEKA